MKTKPRATLAVAVLLLAACGPTAATPPTASEILNKPDQANVKDAHFTLVAHIVSAGVAFDATGDGVIVVKPTPQLPLAECVKQTDPDHNPYIN